MHRKFRFWPLFAFYLVQWYKYKGYFCSENDKTNQEETEEVEKEVTTLEVVQEVLEDMISQVTGEAVPTKGMIDSYTMASNCEKRLWF